MLFQDSVVTKFIRLSSLFVSIVTFSHSNIAHADVEGIPYNPDFPKAQYPYAQAPDACSGVTNRPDSNGEIRDTWGPVDFRGACNTHDTCYYRLGSNWNTCNERLYSDLRAACERDLRIAVRNPLNGKKGYLPPDPIRLSACYTIATGYYAGVQAGVGVGVFRKAQDLQKRYEQWVASIRNSSSGLGFYRQQDRPEVYLVYRPDSYCHVQNEDQMSAFGGFRRVQVVGSLNLNGTNTGDCGWPNGFLKRSNQPEVYRMYGGGIPEFIIGDRFCHVANEDQMNAYGGFGQVRVVSPGSDLGRGRNFTGDCPNP